MTIDRVTLPLLAMRDSAQAAIDYSDEIGRAQFLGDQKTQRAVGMCLIQIGEAAVGLMRDQPAFVASQPALPWAEMRGMRNFVAHGYDALDFGIVGDIVQSSLRALLAQLEVIIPTRGFEGIDVEP